MAITLDGVTFVPISSIGEWKVIQAKPMPDGSVTIPTKVQGNLVTQIAADAFKGMTQLKTVAIPDSIEYIGNNAFMGCENLSRFTVYRTDYAQRVLEINAYAFSSCVNLQTVSSAVPLFLYEGAFTRCYRLNNINAVVSYCSHKTFLHCKELDRIAFDDHAQWVATSFDKCIKLRCIILNGSIGNATIKCENALKAIKDFVIICNANFPHLDLAYSGYKIKIV